MKIQKKKKSNKNKSPKHKKGKEIQTETETIRGKKQGNFKKSAKSNHPNDAKECCLPLGLELSSSVGWLGPKTRRKLNNE